ncbi:MAG: hypothetical protein PHI66_05475 [Candidatus Pacebacteria bacterium]|nr:hypothetical protein [Candidatus Paceibacterota bacterium]
MNQDDAVFSIISEGINSKIKINTPQDCLFKSDAKEIIMRDVEQKSSGGIIEHNARNLIQTGGSQLASDGGKIINSVTNGKLVQVDSNQVARAEGVIMNEVKSGNLIDEQVQLILHIIEKTNIDKKQEILDCCQQILKSEENKKVVLAERLVCVGAGVAQIASLVIQLKQMIS